MADELGSDVIRLVTLVDVCDDGGDEGADDQRVSFFARHEAELADGRRVLLLDDRGWSTSLRTTRVHAAGVAESEAGREGALESDAGLAASLDIWAFSSVADIEEAARVMVGPDEPSGGRSQEDMAAGHWGRLAIVLRAQGAVVDARELAHLPHDVVLSERLVSRIGRARGS